jgi:hypothetical protein
LARLRRSTAARIARAPAGGVRSERRELEVLAERVARLGVLVARLFADRDGEVRVRKTGIRDQRQMGQLQRLINPVGGQRGFGAVGQIAGRLDHGGRGGLPGAPLLRV